MAGRDRAEGKDKVTDVLSAIEYPHWLIVAGAILVMLGLVGFVFRRRTVEPTENGPVTTGTEGNNRTSKGRPWEEAAQNRRDDKKPTPTPGRPSSRISPAAPKLSAGLSSWD